MKVSCQDCHRKLKPGNFYRDEDTRARIHRQCSGRCLLPKPDRSERERRHFLRDAVFDEAPL